MDSENRTYSLSVLLNVYNNICFRYVKETSRCDVSFTHQNICLIEKQLIISIFGGYIVFIFTSL